MGVEKLVRQSKGPSKVPGTISKERRTIQLFLKYSRQLPTTRAMLDNTKSGARRKLQVAIADLAMYYPYSAKNEEELCFLVKYALTFKQLVDAGRKVSYGVLPVEARPSEECIDAMLGSYHQWIQEISDE